MNVLGRSVRDVLGLDKKTQGAGHPHLREVRLRPALYSLADKTRATRLAANFGTSALPTDTDG